MKNLLFWGICFALINSAWSASLLQDKSIKTQEEKEALRLEAQRQKEEALKKNVDPLGMPIVPEDSLDVELSADKEVIGISEDKKNQIESRFLNQKEDVKVGLENMSFAHKVFFVERPSPSDLWSCGIRNHDIVSLEAFVDLNYVKIEGFVAGFNQLNIGTREYRDRSNQLGEEEIYLKDRFSLLTISSRMFEPSWFGSGYKLVFGLKVYKDEFQVSYENSDAEPLESEKHSLLFLSQSYAWMDGLEVGAFVSSGAEGQFNTTMWVPWIQRELNKKWILGLEYYYTNTPTLPLRFLQYGLDADKLEFYNPNSDWFSWMNYGIKYQGESFFGSFTLLNHYSFSGPIIPMATIGWNFNRK